MAEKMNNWTSCPRPESRILQGRYVRLEPLDAECHTRELFDASNVKNAEEKFTWLPEYPVNDIDIFGSWVEKIAVSEDPLYFAVIDLKSGKVGGRQTYMRIDTENGVIEIGNIYWGPLIAGTRCATEALYLFAAYVFDELGYRRFEWKCNNDNLPSINAALRFGFCHEGVFRQHMIVKGLNRDTAWFSIIDKDWGNLKSTYEAWLDPANFDESGRQKHRLVDLHTQA